MEIKAINLFLVIIGFRLAECISFRFTDFLQILYRSTVEFDKIGISYPIISSGVRRQTIVPDDIPFPCDVHLGRSLSPPDSVHRLRPGDIDVIGALGDSLIAGNGAMEEFALGSFIEARGVSWCIGGQGNWRQFLTLPNILKVFNPRLTGYSTDTGEFLSSAARLNFAFPIAATEDILRQARFLVRKIKNDPNINMKKHWKLITIFFGANDICSAQCYSPQQYSPMRHALHLRRAMDYLRLTLPRTLVNLIPVIDITLSNRIRQSAMCKILHPLYCSCLHKGDRPNIHLSKMSLFYQQAIENLVYSGRYDNSLDFTVVLQPFIKLFNTPADVTRAPLIDSSLIAYDCFHLSQKGHALAANLLWNNMLQPVGNKTESGSFETVEGLLCPTRNVPYFFTNVNSRHFRATGRQDESIIR